jgi:predicted enzyme related to lactoylglutathione lyase
MSIHRFCRIELRTTDRRAASAFYGAVLGHPTTQIVDLPPAAVARGAPPNWLGHVCVEDVQAVAARWIARGAVPLGPPADSLVLRDPGGAVLALTAQQEPPDQGVVWYQLYTAGVESVAKGYTELFGWSLGESFDLGRLGRFRQFSWGAGSVPVGTMADTAGRPELHPHWLFYFQVADLEAAIAQVAGHGGKVIGPAELPDGVRLAVCEDPQGAEFGLMPPQSTTGERKC